ncbi:MAG: GTP cyclohydrolase I FolE [Cyanobacteria bacterium P01_D01_bin.36]
MTALTASSSVSLEPLSPPISETEAAPCKPSVSDEEMRQAVRTLLIGLGEDPDREGLIDTPKRVVNALKFLTSGYHQSLEDLLNGAIFHEDAHEMVMVKDIDLFSSCEHHILPILGKAHVAYIPDGKVIGLSKIARICEMYGRRLQVQERLTADIAKAIEDVLQPKGVAVVVEGSHMCMVMRGVQKPGAWTVTSSMRGVFESDAKIRQEFMSLLSHQATFN